MNIKNSVGRVNQQVQYYEINLKNSFLGVEKFSLKIQFDMKIVRNNLIPFKGFKAINLFGILFVRKEAVLTSSVINHEYIHTEQMKELLYVFFYLWYLFEWIVRLFQKGNAYRHISFEREAYANEDNFAYLCKRKRYAFLRYLRD